MSAAAPGEQLLDRSLQRREIARQLPDLGVAVGECGVSFRELLLQPLVLDLQIAR
jgi:hypothetical protein